MGSSSSSSSPDLHDPIRDIIRTGILLSRKLPADLVPIILDYAQQWTSFVSVGTDEEKCVSERGAGMVVLRCVIPKGLPIGVIRQIRFTIESRDQGWSSYPEDYGTYRNSWTWYDVAVRRLQTSHLQADEEEEREAADEEVARTRLVTNLHAGRNWETHSVVWDHSSDDEYVYSVTNQLRGGDSIEISMWARFPGWMNQLKSTRIEVDGLYLRKM